VFFDHSFIIFPLEGARLSLPSVNEVGKVVHLVVWARRLQLKLCV
jgi:hypothetical protein